MEFHALWAVRDGNAPGDYEDALAGDSVSGRFAVADGATESVFAKSWAQLLVDQFVAAADCRPADWSERLMSLQQPWTAGFLQRPLKYYAEMKLQEEGAFATFLGVVVAPAEGERRAWQAVAIGDSCLFHSRQGQLLNAFPVEQAGQFGNTPPLVGSRSSLDRLRQHQQVREGDSLSGDRLWLVTDALAQWCLSEQEAGNCPWAELERFCATETTDEDFALWIEELRSGKRLRNDDVTMLVVRI
jgi:hypothetical protein